MYWKIATTLILILSLCYLSYDYGYDKANTSFLKYKKEQAELIVREQQRLEQESLKLKKEKDLEISRINKRHAAIVSGLQNRPTRIISNPVPEANPAVCPREGSTGERLYREDAEFLIGEAAKAETLKQALLACINNSHRSIDD